MSARRPQSIVLAANELIFGYHQTRPKRKAHLYLEPQPNYGGKLAVTGARSYSARRCHRRRRATGENEQGRLKLDRVSAGMARYFAQRSRLPFDPLARVDGRCIAGL